MNRANAINVMNRLLEIISEEQLATAPVTLSIGTTMGNTVVGGHLVIKQAPHRIIKKIIEFADEVNVILSLREDGLLCDFDLCKPYKRHECEIGMNQGQATATE